MKKIGIIGGGQLGKMMILEAKRLGVYVVTLDPSPDCPSSSISDEHIVADFHSVEEYNALAKKVDIITYEFEHINAHALGMLEQSGHIVYPTAKSLRLIQDKFQQKTELRKANILVPDFTKITSLNELEKFAAANGFPFMLKSCKGGYDGKGNYLIRNKDDLGLGFTALSGSEHRLMAEEFIDFAMEVSVIATRGKAGDIAIYPIAQNVHKDSILDTTSVPANITESQQNASIKTAKLVLETFSGVGTFCVEMFISKSGGVYVNEVAPRPHNSGHYTIEGCRVNQFENHIRAILGLPLGDTSLLHGGVIMRNLLGQGDGPAKVAGLTEAYKTRGVNVHVYGKPVSKAGRKMGHYTVTGTSLAEAAERDKTISKIIQIRGG